MHSEKYFLCEEVGLSHSQKIPLTSGFGLGGWLPRALDEKANASALFPGEHDKSWMAAALVEAMEAIGRASPNPSVGAVLVKNNQRLASGSTQAYGSFHAEKMAINNAGSADLQGAECFVTLEPCGGTGKQGPCADALIAAGVSRVVVATLDPHTKAGGIGLGKLKSAGVETIFNCLEAEAKAWHFPFLAYQEKKSPILIGKWAQTLDGQLADDHDRSQWISGSRSRIYTHWLRQKYDALMIGVSTLLHDQPRLTARDSVQPHARHPHKIIFDPSGRIAGADAKVLSSLFDAIHIEGPIVFWCTHAAIQELPANLKPFHDRVIHVPAIDLSDWPSFLKAVDRGHRDRFGFELQSVLVEGGSQLLTLLMRADQLDACHIFVRAGILGGERNRIGRLERGDNPVLDLMQRRDYRLLDSHSIDDDVLIECVNRRYDLWD